MSECFSATLAANNVTVISLVGGAALGWVVATIQIRARKWWKNRRHEAADTLEPAAGVPDVTGDWVVD
ncbi:hypothetical protein [Trueperella bialowiezensis]|uniref:Uncharacterized protein n=1 Tax=Trueperella bialowiezensis TaxID=312285 RepID=A0A3S4WH82_9ACTO|nr:hypothetical protein [Trueperella bialowiezensis]VEI13875.1 Uncharacterised protein [Trueperella bialowiezensis]